MPFSETQIVPPALTPFIATTIVSIGCFHPFWLFFSVFLRSSIPLTRFCDVFSFFVKRGRDQLGFPRRCSSGQEPCASVRCLVATLNCFGASHGTNQRRRITTQPKWLRKSQLCGYQENILYLFECGPHPFDLDFHVSTANSLVLTNSLEE